MEPLATIELLSLVLSPLTSIELNLVFISRKKTPDIFVGQLRPDADPAPLLKNLQQRKPGPVLELGRLINLEGYIGWHALATAEEQQRLADRSGLKPVPLAVLVEQFNLCRQSIDGAFEDLP